ncbi:hypothetical protein SAMN05428977_101031 [Nitrosomonas sp. Nm166]|nr:hypothetical protein SAMN05428977_101031 [Nitrosomonas sp. Nm166]
MNTGNIPRFTAEASFYRSRRYSQVGAMLTDLQQGGRVLLHPAARPIAYCSMKGCCVDLRDLGFPRICCNGDECGPDVLI